MSDGAANGCSITRGRANPSSHSVPRSTVTTRRASVAATMCLPSLLLRDHRVARVSRRLEPRLEHAPAQRQLAGENECAARDGRRAALFALPGEEPRARERARFRELVELAGLALLVDLADEAELPFHQLH